MGNQVSTEVKKAYVEVAAKLLGLSTDATIERMTPKAMDKIDEFLKTTYEQNSFPRQVLSITANIISLLLPRDASNAWEAIRAIQDMHEKINRINPIFIGVYLAAKHKFAQELWFIFAMNE